MGEAARRASTVVRRSSVVTPTLAAILGKVEPVPGALTFQDAPTDALGGPAVGSRLDGQAFFPDLPQLAKVRSAHSKESLRSDSGDSRSAAMLGQLLYLTDPYVAPRVQLFLLSIRLDYSSLAD